MRIYVLVNTHYGHESRVAEKIRSIPEVRFVEQVYGPYDLIFEAYGHNLTQLVQSVRKIDQVQTILTLVEIEED